MCSGTAKYFRLWPSRTYCAYLDRSDECQKYYILSLIKWSCTHTSSLSWHKTRNGSCTSHSSWTTWKTKRGKYCDYRYYYVLLSSKLHMQWKYKHFRLASRFRGSGILRKPTVYRGLESEDTNQQQGVRTNHVITLRERRWEKANFIFKPGLSVGDFSRG